MMRVFLCCAVFYAALIGCGGDDESDSGEQAGVGGQAGSGGVSGAAGVGGVGGANSGTGGLSGAGATSGSSGSGGDPAMPSAVCMALIAKLEQCGLPAIDPSRCDPEDECEDSCTLSATCAEIVDLGEGNVPANIQACFDGC